MVGLSTGDIDRPGPLLTAVSRVLDAPRRLWTTDQLGRLSAATAAGQVALGHDLGRDPVDGGVLQAALQAAPGVLADGRVGDKAVAAVAQVDHAGVDQPLA